MRFKIAKYGFVKHWRNFPLPLSINQQLNMHRTLLFSTVRVPRIVSSIVTKISSTESWDKPMPWLEAL